MSDLVNEETELFNYKGEDRVVHFTDYVLEKAGEGSRTRTFNCDFPMFDKKIGGLQSGEVITITGNRKEGKTLFAESWVRSLIKNSPDAKTVFFSYETNPDTIVSRYMHEPEAPLYLPLSLQAASPDWLIKRCWEAKLKYDARIIIVDHLGFIVDMSAQQNTSLNIGGVVRQLKRLAMEKNMSILMLAHQNQPKEGREASIDNIGHSAAIGQDTDSTIVVSRKENYNAVEMQDIEIKDPESASKIRLYDNMESVEDKYSMGLTIVKVECHRRTGIYKWKKLFQKRGHFLEEV